MPDYIGSMHVLSERLAEDALSSSNIADLRVMAEWLLKQGEVEAAAELSDLANYLTQMREEIFKKGQNWLPVIKAAEMYSVSSDDKEYFQETFHQAARQSDAYKEMIANLKENKMGGFIKAVKLYRTIFRVGLLEARDACQELQNQFNQ